MGASSDGTVIEWTAPDKARADWLMGAGATRAERAVIWAGSFVGSALVLFMYFRTEPGEWALWQYVLAGLLAWDLFGGAVSNAASSTKRQYFGPDFAQAGGIGRIVRAPVIFTALHVYPFIVVALFPGGSWAWAVAMYVGAVASAVVVDRVVPPYLQRPVAMLAFVTVLLLSLYLTAPPGWAWFPAVYLAKLVLAHAVREEPYRPAPGT